MAPQHSRSGSNCALRPGTRSLRIPGSGGRPCAHPGRPACKVSVSMANVCAQTSICWSSFVANVDGLQGQVRGCSTMPSSSSSAARAVHEDLRGPWRPRRTGRVDHRLHVVLVDVGRSSGITDGSGGFRARLARGRRSQGGRRAEGSSPADAQADRRTAPGPKQSAENNQRLRRTAWNATHGSTLSLSRADPRLLNETLMRSSESKPAANCPERGPAPRSERQRRAAAEVTPLELVGRSVQRGADQGAERSRRNARRRRRQRPRRRHRSRRRAWSPAGSAGPSSPPQAAAASSPSSVRTPARTAPHEQPLVEPQEGQAWQLPARIIWTPHCMQ